MNLLFFILIALEFCYITKYTSGGNYVWKKEEKAWSKLLKCPVEYYTQYTCTYNIYDINNKPENVLYHLPFLEVHQYIILKISK